MTTSLNFTKINNGSESEITRFYAKSFMNKQEIDRDKIMRDIQSSVDSVI